MYYKKKVTVVELYFNYCLIMLRSERESYSLTCLGVQCGGTDLGTTVYGESPGVAGLIRIWWLLMPFSSRQPLQPPSTPWFCDSEFFSSLTCVDSCMSAFVLWVCLTEHDVLNVYPWGGMLTSCLLSKGWIMVYPIIRMSVYHTSYSSVDGNLGYFLHVGY